MNEMLQAESDGLRIPRFQLPAGTVDSHIHVFGPVSRYPYDPARGFTPDDALPSTIAEVFRQAGVDRAVLVQPSVYGTDNRRHLDALGELPIPTRLIAVIDTDVSDSELVKLQAQNACGIRRILPQQLSLDNLADLERLAARISELGWHLQLLAKPEHLIEHEELLGRLRSPVVFDHLALIDPAAGVSQAAFQTLLRLLRGGRCYVKVSGFYRVSKQAAPYSDLKPFVTSLMNLAPDRAVWGSDWPHPAFSGPLPAYAELLDPLLDWVPEVDKRRQLLVTNPAALYGFEAVEGV